MARSRTEALDGPGARGERGALGALGANFNQNLDSVDVRELELAGAEWVRGFYPVSSIDEGDPAGHVAITTILDLAARGYRTILSLKFDYHHGAFPAPGSDDLVAELDRLDAVLPTVMGAVDILTIGNEPFVESIPTERDERLNDFYEALARHVIAYRHQACGDRCRTSLYLGALNRLDLPGEQTAAVDRWLAFARETPEIDGVDIHPHVCDPGGAAPFLDYMLPRLRADQTFLVTEFSPVWYWQQHLTDRVAPEFAHRYGFAADAAVWQVIRAAVDEPFSEQQWNDLLTSSPWFMAQSQFLTDQVRLYRATGRLAVATYGFRQDDLMVQRFGPEKVPWLLNSVFAPYTIELRQFGTAAPTLWLEQFRALQQDRD